MNETVSAARRRIADYIVVTDCRPSAALSRISGSQVRLKLEHLQLSGSFKLRGVMNKLLTLSEEERSRRLVAASTGNHGAAFAHAVAVLGLDGLLYLPTTTTAVKLEAIVSSGIDFELVGDDCVVTENHARAVAAAGGHVWVSPYNDPAVIAGQGTLGLELLEIGDLDTILVPVGGGGLAAGIGCAVKAVEPTIEIIGCEPEASPVMAESIAAGEIVDIPSLPTLSDATAGGIEAGSITFALCREHVDRWERVSEDEIAAALRFVHRHEEMVIEGGAALGVAVLLRRPEYLRGKRAAVVITGSRIDPGVLEGILNSDT
jgi:threonine dehydratase